MLEHNHQVDHNRALIAWRERMLQVLVNLCVHNVVQVLTNQALEPHHAIIVWEDTHRHWVKLLAYHVTQVRTQHLDLLFVVTVYREHFHHLELHHVRLAAAGIIR